MSPRYPASPLPAIPAQFAITDADIHAAMQEIPGYLDITASDFKELYMHSYRHALARLTSAVQAGEIMTRKVITVDLDTPLHEVAARMAEAGISGVVVLNGEGRPTGIISERDFLHHLGSTTPSFMAVVASCLRGIGCAALNIRKGVAADIMSRPVRTVREDATLAEVAALFTEQKINRVPVLDREGRRLVGILSRGDLVRAQVMA